MIDQLEYNTERDHLIIPEYGRHIQKMVDQTTVIEDREERNKVAKAIIAVMGNLQPHLRDVPDFQHKLWDQLFIMSDF
ncbi:MAG: CRISPR/Cas system-associated endonuclease Cas1, partial [Dokdonia sp.]